MYVWKCWRDTRAFFIAFTVIAAAVTPVTAVLGVGTGLLDGFGKTVFIPALGAVTMLLALGLGTLCAIQEFTDKTAHFLFTKPRTRRYFVWAGWTVGFAEYSAVVLANVLAGWLTLYHYSKVPFMPALFGAVKLQNIAAVFISSLMVFSLTYALTAVFRNGLKGLGATMGTLMVFQAAVIGIRLRWNFDLDQVVWKLSPIIRDIGWTLVALTFVFAAQLVIDRAEI